jgi:hypothetical protein
VWFLSLRTSGSSVVERPYPTPLAVKPAVGGEPRRLAPTDPGYVTVMLYTILIILAIIALLMFIFGRRRV